jgi:hypothetical protein
MNRAALGVLIVLGIGLVPAFVPVTAHSASPRAEYWEGRAEIARERRRMRRDILNANSRQQAERAFRRGMAGIAHEKREMRREVRRAVRRRFVGRAVAGVVLGSMMRPPVIGRPPRPPSPDLCWFWSDMSRTQGYWYYCRGD